MTYPGNPTLPIDVQQRIRSTFEHTLGLAEQGSAQEALLGCDFVLRMDPQFEPARRLQERLDGATGAVAVGDLRKLDGRATGTHESLWSDLAGLAPELPEVPEHLPATSPAEIRAEFQGLLAERRFQELQDRAARERTLVIGDLELERIVALAQERLEAAPYVSKFLLSAREAQRVGNPAEAARLLEKAKSLDPTHPGIAELGGGPPPAAAKPRRKESGEIMTQQLATMPQGMVPPTPAPEERFNDKTMAYAIAGAGDSESERRIQQLLETGQAALNAGDPQAAIDAWSRIFLIDIDHQEASRRIEEARRVKAERDRQVEETLHDGLTALESRDASAARAAFQHVLELQPGHLKAREYLQQLDEGLMPSPAAARPTGGTFSPLASPPPSAPPAGAGYGAGLEADLQEEILVPPDIDPGSARAEPRQEVRSASVSAHEGRARRLFMVVGGCVLCLIVVVGWFLYQKRETWFPNSRTEEPAQPQAPNPIPRATKLHDSGKVSIALTQLRRVAPGDPHYKEAQALIAKWQDEGQGSTAGSGSGVAAPGTPADASAHAPGAERRTALLEQAHKAIGERSFLVAAERFGAADKLGTLDAVDAAQFAAAKQHLLPIQREVAMFTGHDWEYALPVLWSDHQADPGNKDVSEMIVSCYYDLAIQDLRHGDVQKAADKLAEAEKIDPNDPDLKRQLLFAQTYAGRDTDLLYRIYVKYLAYR